MPATRDGKTWRSQFYYEDWQGIRHKKNKRGFKTKSEAEEWERNFRQQQKKDLDINFESFVEIYFADMENRLRESTIKNKRYVFDLKVTPYFKRKKMCEIKTADIRAWQNELIKQGYAPTYLKSINNQLAALFNYAVRYYDLKDNPCRKAGSIGKSKADDMEFWTKQEFKQFLPSMDKKPEAKMAFLLLYWTGMRIGELLALTYEDIDLEKRIISVSKTYQRFDGKDVITPPKTPKSNRKITIPPFLAEALKEYCSHLYGIMPNERIFRFTKSYMEHPACGSGGFLIQAFRYVNAKIDAAGLPEVDNIKKFNALIDKCLWGHEADYDLHVLAKINLIMHGDGWNNIYQGDTLKSEYLPDNSFDLILENPPFTIPYTFSDVLEKYELGIGKEKEELDLLFVEKSIRLLKPGKDMYIILPEGIMNIKKYQYFRQWLLEKTDILLSVSLPEGAFIPFGGSVSKTCILAVRKRGDEKEGYISPKYVFLGRAKEVGYEVGKKTYIEKNKNDLLIFEKEQKSIFEGIHETKYGGECGWITQDDISDKRLDASYLLNKIEREALRKKFDILVPLNEVCKIENEIISPLKNREYYYLEVPDISADTGVITNVRKLPGYSIGDSFHKFYAGDILFTRINPRKRRVAIAPPIKGFGLVSKEVYRLVYKENEYISKNNWYILCAILQSDLVSNQIVRLSTGSSSSRARVQTDDLLNDVYIPIPDDQTQERISTTTKQSMNKVWKMSQSFLKIYTNNQALLGNKIDKKMIRGI